MRSYTRCKRLTVEGRVVGIFEELVSLKGGNCNVCNLRIGWKWVEEGKKERTVFVGWIFAGVSFKGFTFLVINSTLSSTAPRIHINASLWPRQDLF